jgi:endonuclease/exonuclease/phosphatase family metal-dependent hydrolase
MLINCLSWNVLAQCYSQGFDVKPWDQRLKSILDFISSRNFDIICLQELDLKHFNQDYQSLFEKYQFSVHQINKHRSNIIGNAILWKKDKFELIVTESASYSIFAQLKLSGVLEIKVPEPKEDLLFINLHLKAGLHSNLSTRISQLNSCLKKSRSFKTNQVVVCGDFNDDFSNDALQKILEEDGFLLTLGYDDRQTCILKDGTFRNFDHVACRNLSCNYDDHYSLTKIPNDEFASDHFPVTFDIKIF